MLNTFLSLALVSGGLFAGSCLYVSVVAHPVRMALGEDVALPVFMASLRRSERLQPTLHLVCLLSTISTAVLAPGPQVITALVLLAPILPLSLIVILPVARAITTDVTLPGAQHVSPDTMTKLERWGRLHMLRTAFGLLAFVALAVTAGKASG